MCLVSFFFGRIHLLSIPILSREKRTRAGIFRKTFHERSSSAYSSYRRRRWRRAVEWEREREEKEET
jgi:hypothetical protein